MVFGKAGAFNQIIDLLMDGCHKNDNSYRFSNNRSVNFCVCYFTIFTFCIHTPQLLIILYLKFEQVQFTAQCCA